MSTQSKPWQLLLSPASSPGTQPPPQRPLLLPRPDAWMPPSRGARPVCLPWGTQPGCSQHTWCPTGGSGHTHTGAPLALRWGDSCGCSPPSPCPGHLACLCQLPSGVSSSASLPLDQTCCALWGHHEPRVTTEGAPDSGSFSGKKISHIADVLK